MVRLPRSTLVLVVSTLMVALGVSSHGAAPPTSSHARLFEQAVQLVERRERVVTELIAVVGDEKAANSHRKLCADLLGRLQHERAVPALIGAIDLRDEAFWSTGAPGSPIGHIEPAPKALWEMGDMPLLELVFKFRSGQSADARRPYLYALAFCVRDKQASRYVRGVQVEMGELMFGGNLRDLYIAILQQ